jgi:hypothetical protein
MAGTIDITKVRNDTRKSISKALTNVLSDTEAAELSRNVDEVTKKLEETLREKAENEKKIKDLQAQVTVFFPASQVDLSDTASVETYLNTIINGQDGSFEKARVALSDQVKKALMVGTVKAGSLRDTNISEEIEYNKQAIPKGDKGCKLDSNVLNSIPEFSGENEVEWRNFEQAWMVAIRNHRVDEGSLMTALIPRLKGRAKTFYMAETVRLQDWSFTELMQRLRERYKEEKLQAENAISGLTQGKDSVRDFAARIQVAAHALYPSHPGKYKVLRHNNGATTIPNPMYDQEMGEYHRMVEKAESGLMKIFMSGLRNDIQARLPSEIYRTFEQVVEGAKKAEWIQGGITAGMLQKCTNHLYTVEESTNDECHAMVRRENKKTDGTAKFEGMCWSCQEPGHTKRQCPKKKTGFNNTFSGNGNQTSSFNRGPRDMNRPRGGFTPGKGGRGGRRQLPTRLRNHLRVDRFQGPRRNFRDNNTRKWMVKSRAKFNTRRRMENSLYNLEYEVDPGYSEQDYTEEERELFHLEQEMNDDEFKEYEAEVFGLEEELDEEVNSIQSKN